MDNVNTVTQPDAEDTGDTVRTTILFPKQLWKGVKIAAIEADKTAQDFVIAKMAEVLGLKAA